MRVHNELKSLGWEVATVWECEVTSPDAATEAVLRIIQGLNKDSHP
jgi:G:T-mismatch repair DNA endonuclease (very short patch repair protein)